MPFERMALGEPLLLGLGFHPLPIEPTRVQRGLNGLGPLSGMSVAIPWPGVEITGVLLQLSVAREAKVNQGLWTAPQRAPQSATRPHLALRARKANNKRAATNHARAVTFASSNFVNIKCCRSWRAWLLLPKPEMG